MAATPLSPQELMEVLALVRQHGSIMEASKAAGINRSTLEARWRRAKRIVSRRQAQANYQRSAKGKATAARYNRTKKRSASNARYRASVNGHQVVTVLNQCRIFVGATYRGRAVTANQAARIRHHIKQRLHAFTRQQARAEVEGASSGTVSAEAITGAD